MQTAKSRIWAEATRLAHARPWQAVSLAAAAGYLLGGGLLSPLTRRLVALGMRFRMQHVLHSLIASHANDTAVPAEIATDPRPETWHRD